jgi:GntR family transcriptional regulator
VTESPNLPTGPARDRRPLSVQVYDRLIEALRASDVRPGDAIPPEIGLAAQLGVSRTVLREALRLLEEDGVLTRGADRRRRHLAVPADRSSGFQAPLEELLQVPGGVRVTVVRSEVLPATSWSARLLDVDPGTELVCRESLLVAGTDPVASALELVPLTEVTAPGLLEPSMQAHAGQTLLAALGPQYRSRLAPTLWRLAPGVAQATRTGLDRLPRIATMGSLTTVLSRHGRPVHLAKHAIRLDAVVLAVGPSPTDIEWDDDQLTGQLVRR